MTMVWVVSRSRVKAHPGTSSPYISPLTPSGQRNCASWASQPQKLLHFRHSQRGNHESSYEHEVALEKKFSFPAALRPNTGHSLLIHEVSNHTQGRTTVGRTHLDE